MEHNVLTQDLLIDIKSKTKMTHTKLLNKNKSIKQLKMLR